MTSPVSTDHKRANLSDDAVNKSFESYEKAKSHIHRLFVSLHSFAKLKLMVRQILAVPSADEVAISLK